MTRKIKIIMKTKLLDLKKTKLKVGDKTIKLYRFYLTRIVILHTAWNCLTASELVAMGRIGKCMFLYSAVFSQWDRSKRFLLHPSGKHSTWQQLLRENVSFTYIQYCL